jgi:hypothetical protein
MNKVIDIDNMTKEELIKYEEKLLKDIKYDKISFEDYINEFTRCNKALEKFPKYDKYCMVDSAARIMYDILQEEKNKNNLSKSN